MPRSIATRIGRRLEFDAKTERITNDREGDALVKRLYREPFSIPDVV